MTRVKPSFIPLTKGDTFRVGGTVRRVLRGATTPEGPVSYEQLFPEKRSGHCRALIFRLWAERGEKLPEDWKLTCEKVTA